MELKLRPVFVFLLFGVLMFLLAKFSAVGFFDFFGRSLLFWILTVFGVLISLSALVQFYTARTTIDPTNPKKSSSLVTHGVYTFSRNPMYLAMLLFLLALGIALGNAFNTLVAAGFVAYMNRFQIIPEEQALLEKFGRSFKEYCTLTRRWF